MSTAVSEAAERRKAREREQHMNHYRLAVRVREQLHEVLRAAGVTGLTPLIDDDNPLDKITLPALSAEKGLVVAELMRKAMAVDFTVADMVRDAFKTNGVNLDVWVIDRRLSFGTISVADADLIAVLLGAPDTYADLDDLAEFDDWPVAQDVAARLEAMVSEATGALLGTDFRPGGPMGGSQAVIQLGRLDIDAARKIALILDPRVAR